MSGLTAVDLFAGLGGFTEGARRAGARVVWAANHWRLAVDFHAANHAEVQHACEDLHLTDWTKVPSVDLVLASPACQGHSRARGVERPHHDAARATAWAVVSAVEALRPRAFVVENVTEFLSWTLYPSWRSALDALGYSVAESLIDAADLSVPQHRKRVFVVGLRNRRLFMLPTPAKRHRPAREILDLDEGGADWVPVDAPDPRGGDRL